MKSAFMTLLMIFLMHGVGISQNQEYAWVTLLQTPLSNEYPAALFELDGGELVVFGFTQSGSGSPQNSLMIKFSPQGDTTLSRTFIGKRFSKVIDIPDDRFLAFEWNTDDTAIHAYKISRTGDVLWEKKLIQSLWDGFHSGFNITMKGDGTFEMLGTQTDSLDSTVIVDFLVDSLLDSLWAGKAIVDTVYATYTPRIHGKVNGGHIVSAQIYQQTYGFSHFKHHLMKIDSTGHRVWTVKLLPTTFSQQSLLSYGLAWLEVLPSGNVSLLLSTSPTGGTHPMETEWIVVDNAGKIIRQRSLGTNIVYNHAFQMRNGERIFTGHNSSLQARYVLKTDSLGNRIDLKVMASYGYNINPGQVILTRDSGLVFADYTAYPGSIYDPAKQDIVLSKLNQGAIAVERKPAAPAFVSITASPNPFNPVTVLSFPNPHSNASIEVFDVSGKSCKTFERVMGNRHAMDFGGMGNGLYLVRVISGGKRFQKAITLLK